DGSELPAPRRRPLLLGGGDRRHRQHGQASRTPVPDRRRWYPIRM
ncbi:MAG: hypothetical protein AVDCRST_MAG59-1846, partial [uncultured Thermomicrobiales bacterium]